MVNLTELKNFYLILDDPNCNVTKKLKILKVLENWVPVKDYIIISNIGKALYRCSKLSNELGLKASSIVNKWKSLILKPQNSSNNINILKKTPHSSFELKMKNIPRKLNQNEVPQKKSCLSLNDYYKRKGIDLKKNTDINDNNENDDFNENCELTSELGISFMDSFTMKPVVNIKPKKLLKISEICALTSTDSIRQRNDIIKSPTLEHNISPAIDRLTERVDSSLKCWVPKVIKHNYTCGKQPESLLKLCQDILLENRMYIEEVYMTPRELLLTVLENYSPEQLQRFEYFNPHYIDDNDELWHKHFSARHFNYERKDKETWRKAYMRAVNSVQQKFELSIQNMKTKMEAIEKLVPKISVMSGNGLRRPEHKHLFHRWTYDSNYSKASQKLRRQYKKQFAHLPF